MKHQRLSHKTAIPDPEDWLQEHYVLASVAQTLTVFKQLLCDEGLHEDSHISYTAEGELVLGTQARDLLKASYGDDHWQYVENYL